MLKRSYADSRTRLLPVVILISFRILRVFPTATAAGWRAVFNNSSRQDVAGYRDLEETNRRVNSHARDFIVAAVVELRRSSTGIDAAFSSVPCFFKYAAIPVAPKL